MRAPQVTEVTSSGLKALPLQLTWICFVFFEFFFGVWWWSVDRVSSRALQIGTDRRVLAGWASACMRTPWTPFSNQPVSLCQLRVSTSVFFLFSLFFGVHQQNFIAGPLERTPVRDPRPHININMDQTPFSTTCVFLLV